VAQKYISSFDSFYKDNSEKSEHFTHKKNKNKKT